MHVVTLVTGDYDFGAAALINSLAKAEFSGRITVGHQGPLDWEVRPGAPVTYHKLDDFQKWGGNLKAQLLLNLGSGDVCFIDADCIVTSSQLLKLTSEIVGDQPLFAVEGIMPACDIRRIAWARCLSRAAGRAALRNEFVCLAYMNSGFFALRLPRDELFLQQWQKAMKLCLAGAGQLFETPFFPMADQDCLNAVLANLEFPFATIGPPDIWYKAQAVNPYLHVGTATESILLHCTGALKPWRLKRPMVWSPDIYDRLFYRFAFLETPWIRLSRKLPRAIERWIKDDLRSRIYRRVRRAASQFTPRAGT
jgi:hypothetical protein